MKRLHCLAEGLAPQLDARLRHHAAGRQPAVPRHPERGVARAAGDRAVYGVDAVLVQTGGRGDAAQDVLQEAGEVLLAALQAVALHVIVRRFRRGEAVVPPDHGRVAAQRGEHIGVDLKDEVPFGGVAYDALQIPAGHTTFHDAVYGDVTVDNADLDDQVLIKSDGLPTYNFANVIDDHLMGITHVVRGSEYLSSSPKYNLLYEAFGWEIPTYVHCASVMITDPETKTVRKMSKRHGDPSYEDLLKMGYLSDAILNYVTLLGWSPKGDIAEQEFFTMEELIQVFDIEGISKSPSAFDMEKLKYFNSHYIRSMTPEEFSKAAEPYIRQTVQNPHVDVAEIADLLHQRTETMNEIPEKVDFFDKLPDYDIALYTHKKSKTNAEISLEMLQTILPRFEALEPWEPEGIKAVMTDLAAELEVKNAKIMWPVRIAIAGKAVTPGGAVEIAHILGKEESIARMKQGIEKLSV